MKIAEENATIPEKLQDKRIAGIDGKTGWLDRAIDSFSSLEFMEPKELNMVKYRRIQLDFRTRALSMVDETEQARKLLQKANPKHLASANLVRRMIKLTKASLDREPLAIIDKIQPRMSEALDLIESDEKIRKELAKNWKAIIDGVQRRIGPYVIEVSPR